MTDKSPAPEKQSPQTSVWEMEPLPPTASRNGGWSLVIMLCLMLGVISGYVIFHHDLGSGVMMMAASWLVFWVAFIILMLMAIALILALRGYWRLAWLSGAVAVTIIGQVIIIHDLRSVPLSVAVPKDEIMVTALVVESQRYRGNRQQIIIRLKDKSPVADQFADGSARLLVPSGVPPLLPGDMVVMQVNFQPLLPQLLPGGYDFERHALRRGILAGGFVREIVSITPGQGWSLAKARRSFQDKLFQHMDNAWGAPVASALLIGYRAAIPHDLREAWRGAGLAHLLAISGLHMMLICGVIMVLVRSSLALFPVFSSRFNPLKLSALLALPLCLFYLFFAGVPVSALRAFLMLGLSLIAVLVSRRGITLHHVQLAAIIILLCDPSSLFGPAFQMSFSAVFGLVVVWTYWQQYRPFRPISWPLRLVRYVLAIALSSVIATLASLPFALHHFGVTTTWSVLANVLGMPLMGFVIMPMGAAAVALAPLGFEALPLSIMNAAILLLSHFASVVSGWQGARLAVLPPSALATLGLASAFMIMALIQGRWRWLGVPLVGLAVLLWTIQQRPLAGVILDYGKPMLAVTSHDGRLVISSSRDDGFAARLLATSFGFAEAVYIRNHEDSVCGDGFCTVLSGNNQVIAMVWDRRGLTKACQNASLVLSLVKAKYPCTTGAELIDEPMLYNSGGMLIYATSQGQSYRIKSVNIAE